MKFTKQSRFIGAIVLQVVILFSIIIFKLTVLAGGTDILLRIEPVDPTSPLRGDYATFRYSGLSQIQSYLAYNEQIYNGQTVYVVLHQEGEYWYAERIQKDKPAPGNQTFLKGKVSSGGFPTKQGEFFPQVSGEQFQITYGIEEYYIPERSGRNLSFVNHEAAAVVTVDDEGNAVLKKIMVDGKKWP